MSAEREIEKCLEPFVEAVRSIMKNKFLDRNGTIVGTQRIWGYVCKVHDDKEDELFGTIDVQEYEYDAPEGFHEGVQLGALQNNSNGQVTIPKMYSDVVIAQDPVTLVEYVVLSSHVDSIQMKSHTLTTVGVAETEEFVEDEVGENGTITENGPDVQDLPETGNFAKSSYTKDKIKHHYKSKDGEDACTEYNKTHILHKISSSKGETTIEQCGDKILIKAQNSTITINSDGDINIKSKNITVEGDKIEVKGSQFIRKGKSNTDMQGGFCGIPVCPFTGAPHTGSIITGG